MKLSILSKDLYLRLVGNPKSVYVMVALVAMVLAAAGGTKWE